MTVSKSITTDLIERNGAIWNTVEYRIVGVMIY